MLSTREQIFWSLLNAIADIGMLALGCWFVTEYIVGDSNSQFVLTVGIYIIILQIVNFLRD